MLATEVMYGVMAATLVAIAVYAISASRRLEINSVKNFVRYEAKRNVVEIPYT